MKRSELRQIVREELLREAFDDYGSPKQDPLKATMGHMEEAMVRLMYVLTGDKSNGYTVMKDSSVKRAIKDIAKVVARVANY